MCLGMIRTMIRLYKLLANVFNTRQTKKTTDLSDLTKPPQSLHVSGKLLLVVSTVTRSSIFFHGYERDPHFVPTSVEAKTKILVHKAKNIVPDA